MQDPTHDGFNQLYLSIHGEATTSMCRQAGATGPGNKLLLPLLGIRTTGLTAAISPFKDTALVPRTFAPI